MEIKGKDLRIGNTESIGEKGFRKRELILEVAENPQYPQIVKFEANKDNCDKLDSLKAGDLINLNFNLNGREWTNKDGVISVFNTLTIWKWDVLSSSAPTPDPTPASDEPLPF